MPHAASSYVAERLRADPGAHIAGSDLLADYAAWAGARGAHIPPPRLLAPALLASLSRSGITVRRQEKYATDRATSRPHGASTALARRFKAITGIAFAPVIAPSTPPPPAPPVRPPVRPLGQRFGPHACPICGAVLLPGGCPFCASRPTVKPAKRVRASGGQWEAPLPSNDLARDSSGKVLIFSRGVVVSR